MHFDGFETLAIAHKIAQKAFFGFCKAEAGPLGPVSVKLLIGEAVVVGAVTLAEGSVFVGFL